MDLDLAVAVCSAFRRSSSRSWSWKVVGVGREGMFERGREVRWPEAKRGRSVGCGCVAAGIGMEMEGNCNCS